MRRMRRAFRSAALVAVLLAGLCGAARTRAEPAAWHVAEGRGELWLLGSVHYLRAADYPLPAIVDRLYAHADALLFELDLDDLDPAAAETEFETAARLPAGDSLARELGPKLYATAEDRAHALGLSLRFLDGYEPWLAALTLLNQGMLAKGFDADRGVEQYLLAKAKRDGKPILGLESLDTQIHVFAALDPAGQRALLAQTLQELDSPRTEVGPLITAWRQGRSDALARELLTDFKDFPALYESLVAARNRAWAAELEHRLAAGQRLLVVVGALHLVGPNSVIDLLTKRGHDVRTHRRGQALTPPPPAVSHFDRLTAHRLLGLPPAPLTRAHSMDAVSCGWAQDTPFTSHFDHFEVFFSRPAIRTSPGQRDVLPACPGRYAFLGKAGGFVVDEAADQAHVLLHVSIAVVASEFLRPRPRRRRRGGTISRRWPRSSARLPGS